MRCRCSLTTLRFLGLWLFIAAVSSYDAYLLVRHSDSIMYLESNPLGVYLLKLADGDVSVFVNCKAAGTVVVLGLLLGLYRRCRHWAIPVVQALAVFQLGLLLYLTIVDLRPKLALANSAALVSQAEDDDSNDQHAELPSSDISEREIGISEREIARKKAVLIE